MEHQLRFAQERIENLETKFEKHLEDHDRFEAAITENTRLTRSISENTQELVDLVKGAKGLRSFVVWAAPIAACFLALWAWVKAQAGS